MKLDVAHAEIGEIEFGDTGEGGASKGEVGAASKGEVGEVGAEMEGEESCEGRIGVVEGAVAEDFGWGVENGRCRGRVVHIGGAQPVGLGRVVVHIGGIKIRAESVDGGSAGHGKKSSCQIFGRKKNEQMRFGKFPISFFGHSSFFRRVFSSTFFFRRVFFSSPFCRPFCLI